MNLDERVWEKAVHTQPNSHLLLSFNVSAGQKLSWPSQHCDYHTIIIILLLSSSPSMASSSVLREGWLAMKELG